MNITWRDLITTILAAAGMTEVWAKFYDYSWWLIGSWRGAAAVLGGLGLAVLAVRLSELADMDNWVNFIESLLWVSAAGVIVVAMFVTSAGLFYTGAAVLGVIWLSSLVRHIWHTTHHTRHPYATVH